jgi:Na+-driven multidrug efflux pump
VFAATGLTSEEIEAGESYFLTTTVFLPFQYAVFACSGIIYGLFDLPIFVLVLFTAAVLNVVGTFLLIEVFKFGLFSDALMTGISALLVTLLCFAYFRSARFERKNGFSMTSKPKAAPWISLKTWKSFGVDNVYLFIYDVTTSFSLLLLIPISARFSTNAEAGIIVVVAMGSIPLAVARGFTMAVNMLGSMFVARRVYLRLRQIMAKMTLMIMVPLLGLGVVMLIWPDAVTKVLLGKVSTPDVLAEIKYAWYAFAAAMPALAILSTLEGVMYATQRFATVAVVGVVATIAVFVPILAVGIWKESITVCYVAWVAFVFARAAIFAGLYFFRIAPEHRRAREEILQRIAKQGSSPLADSIINA